MDWCRDTVLSFLNLIRERPVIWDTQNRDYKDKQKRQAAVEEIALFMGCSVKTINSKWTSLKNQYSREKRNMTGMRTGSGANAIYTTKWYAFKEMESLMEGNTPEQTYDNLCEIPPPPTTPPTPPPATPPTPPPTTPTPLPITRTPPPTTPTPPKARETKKKRNSGLYAEAMLTLKAIKERKTKTPELDDDITSYGLYIAAQMRKFQPILQSRLKLDIQTLLCKYEIENIENRSGSSLSDQSDHHHENPQSPISTEPTATTFKQPDIPQTPDPTASTSTSTFIIIPDQNENEVNIPASDTETPDPPASTFIIIPDQNENEVIIPASDRETEKAIEYLLKFNK